MSYIEKTVALTGEKYYFMHHSSGADIIVIPKDFVTTYALFATKYGSVDRTFKTDKDDDYITVPDGVAHFLEHKLFENEDGEDTFARYARFGGSANAYTSFEKTAYLFSCTENFGENFEILLDFVQKPFFSEETVKKEQGIIGQEIKMYDDMPSWCVFFNMLSALYKNHPVAVDIAGTVESISQITPEILYRCYNTFYNLNNMVICVCGNVTPEQIEKIADKMLKKSEVVKVSVKQPEEPSEINFPSITKNMDVSMPLYSIGIKQQPALTTEEKIKAYAEYEILMQMFIGRCSDFYSELYENNIISGGCGASYEAFRDVAYISISGSADDPQKVYDAIIGEMKARRENFYTVDEFERAKKIVYSSDIFSLDSTEEIANDVLGFYMEGIDAFDMTEATAKVTYDDIKARFDMALVPEKTVISVIMPNA